MNDANRRRDDHTSNGICVASCASGHKHWIVTNDVAMSNGSFLSSRGAIHGALAESGFNDDEIRRSWEALGYGSWAVDDLLTSWGQQVASANKWRERRYGGYRVICLDLTAFWRPCLQGNVSKHYNSAAQKALPAIVFGVMSISGEIGSQRLPPDQCDCSLCTQDDGSSVSARIAQTDR